MAQAELARAATERGRRGGPYALDYFVFPRGLFQEIPPLVVGRARWDNWMIWGARAAGARVIDLTPVVTPIHQSHGYEHHPEGGMGVHGGPDVDWNEALGVRDIRLAKWYFGRPDATHVLTPEGVERRGPRASVRWWASRAARMLPWVPVTLPRRAFRWLKQTVRRRSA